MIARPQSLESFKGLNHYNYTSQPQYQMRKKVQNFTFLPSDKIGRGYSSIVYKGENDLTKQPVAIKVIQLKSLKDQNTKRFLQNELECLRRLDHANVLRYVNSFMTANNCYIITELYNGGDLAKELKQKVFFQQHEIFEIFTQFYKGYKHFHSRGFIHRDIKPSNILIQSGQNLQKSIYVIADFGFIKHLDENPKDSFNVGTPVYMAPQSITSNIYTVKSDIWSMGVMLFEMAFGSLPFQCKSESDLRREICNKEIRLQDVEDHKQIFMSIEFKTLLLSCLRKNPENRLSLQEVGAHPWMKKYSPQHDLDIRMPKSYGHIVSTTTNLRRPVISLSRDRLDSTPKENAYGYIGNQAIKREKSLQANNFSLKNYQPNNTNKTSFTKDYDLSVERHREKARQLGVLSLKGNAKENQQKIKQPEPYFVQNYLKDKLNITANGMTLSDSPKINFLIQKKNGIQPRSSLLQGMKGIVNIKNSQILRINNYDSKNPLKNPEKRRQSTQKADSFQTNIETSTSLEENKYGSAESLEAITLLDVNAPRITSFQSISPNTSNQYDTCTSLTKLTEPSISLQSENNNKQNIAFNANFSHPYSTPLFSQPLRKLQYIQKLTAILPKEFFFKSIHLLRYVYETLTLLNDIKGETQEKFSQTKQSLEGFLVVLLELLKKSLSRKEDLFGLDRWNEFCESPERYKQFVEVIEKYHDKYSTNTLLRHAFKTTDNLFLKQQQRHNEVLHNPQRYHQHRYTLLKYAEELSSANKQLPKKSLRTSCSFNSLITTIFHLHKCLQTVALYCETLTSKSLDLLLQIYPDKELQEMSNSYEKKKDPFKIPKIVIQLKKKLIQVEKGAFCEKNESSRREMAICQNRSSMNYGGSKISVK